MNSTDSLEKALRASLQPVDPGAAFTAALRARLLREDLPTPEALPTPLGSEPAAIPSVRARRLYSASLALAASVVLALSIGWQLTDLHTARLAAQARAHAQLLLALEITGERLSLAQQRIEQFQTQEHNP